MCIYLSMCSFNAMKMYNDEQTIFVRRSRIICQVSESRSTIISESSSSITGLAGLSEKYTGALVPGRLPSSTFLRDNCNSESASSWQ